MAVDRGGLQYTLEARDQFSAVTREFQKQMRESKRAFSDFQNTLRAQRGAAKSLRETAQASRELAKARREQARASRTASTQETEADRFARKRERSLQSLRDQVRLLKDAEVRRARDLRRAATQDEKAASAVVQKANAEKQAARAAREAERAEKRLADQRARQARADRARGESAAAAQRQAELRQLREDIQQRAALQQQADRVEQRRIDERLRTAVENQRRAERIAETQRRAQLAEQRVRERQIEQERRLQERARRDQERRDPRLQAQRQLNDELFQEQIRREKISQLRARAQQQFAARDIAGARQTLQQARELEGVTRRTARNTNNIFFSFRRLIGILAVFTLARRTVQEFNNLVRLGLRFGDSLEAARTSIAGIVIATGTLRDEFGNTVAGAEALVRAEELAGRQIRALRQDALRTTATFEELLDTFQVAVAPGIAAGLNLDEIRRLSVSISQAATAIGLPQNQLAEEIRSLLSGTIQARTTRIATALGITNADIRRLRETGELFDFLEERFNGFAEAAQKQARSTLEGIRALVQGALGEVLGRAAQPLRDELLTLLNDILDDVLTIQDETGRIVPRPEAVAAFQALFEALRLGVERARQLGEELGFEGVQDLTEAIGSGLVTAIEFVIGFVETLLGFFEAILAVVETIKNTFNLTNRELGRVAGTVGTVVAALFIWRQTLGAIGLDFVRIFQTVRGIGASLLAQVGVLNALNGSVSNLLRLAARFAALIGVVIGGINLLVRAFTGLDVSFGDTIDLIFLSFQELFGRIVRTGEIAFKSLANSVVGIFLDPIGFLAQQFATLLGALGGAAAVARSLGIISEESRQEVENAISGLEQQARNRGRDSQFALFSEEQLQKDKRELFDFLEESEQRFAEVRARISSRGVLGEGFDEEFAAAAQAAQQAGSDIETGTITVLSNVRKSVEALAESLVKLEDELEETRNRFNVLSDFPDLGGGVGGQIEDLFDDAQVRSAEELRRITAELNTATQARADVIDRLATGEGDQRENAAILKSLNQDIALLLTAQANSQDLGLQLATAKAAVLARQSLPGFRQENELLAQQAELQERVAAAQAAQAGARQLAVIQAQAALEIARVEARQGSDARNRELQSLRNRAAGATGEEAQVLNQLISELEQRATLEDRIAAAKLQQLELALREAELVASGTITDGLREGFNAVLEDLPTAFEAGVNIIRGSVQALGNFISQTITDAFDPTKDVDLLERFAQFMQQIAQIILNQLVQLAIAKALLGLGFGPVPGGAAEGGQVPAEGFHKGGKVRRGGRPSLAHMRAEGLAFGGRPRGLDPRDTVPAWLQPGEFVIRKAAVDQFGLPFFQSVNGGDMPVTGSASAATSATAGMQTGGIVSDARLQTEASAGSNETVPIVLPVLPVTERESDTIQRGGRNAKIRWYRENAGDIRAALGIADRR